jgi:hypothetical protein
LLSILILVALIAPAITITTVLFLSVSTVSADPGYDNVVRGGVNFFANDINPPPPRVMWEAGDRPPLMVAKTAGAGAFVACGFCHNLRNGRWNDRDIPPENHTFDNLLDAAFQWMVPGATKVLWYEGYSVYNQATPDTPGACDQLADSLKDMGYTVDIDATEPIDESVLTGYDILILPQLEEGDPGTGGDPGSIDDSSVDNVVAWVNAGSGVIIFDGADTFGHNYCMNQNKFLKALDPTFEIPFLQSDEGRDAENSWSGNEWEMWAEVDTSSGIGSAYQSAVGTAMVPLYMPCTLAPKENYMPGLIVSPSGPVFQQGLPGGTLNYGVEVWNLGWLDDNFILSIKDNIWPVVLWDNVFEFKSGEHDSTTLSVIVPSDATFGDSDTITVTVKSEDVPTENQVVKCTAVVSMRVGPPMADAYVNEQQPNTNYGGEIVTWLGSTANFYLSAGVWRKNQRTWMKFDLSGIPAAIPPMSWTKNNLHARLYTWCWGIHGAWGKNVQCRGRGSDIWLENEITWNNPPGASTLLDTARVATNDGWVSWDVTDFVRSESQGDGVASFCLMAEIEGLDYPDNFAYEFYTREERDENVRLPFIAIGYDVDARITPDYAEAMPGGTISYNVEIMNMGSVADNFDLTASDDAVPSWNPSIQSEIELQPGVTERVDIEVQIDSGATPCAIDDNVTVTVKSEDYPDNANDSATCVAHPSAKRITVKEDSSTRGVEVIPLENSVWGIGDHDVTSMINHVENTMWIGRESVFAGPDYYYEVGPQRGWLKFDLRGITTSLGNVERVTLNLYCPPRFSGMVASVENGPVQVQVCGIGDDSWSEDEITWSNEPPIGDVLDTRSITEDSKWYSWDITDFVKSELTANENYASLCLVDLGENVDPPHWVHFDSKEFALENQWPYLEILTSGDLPSKEVRVYIDPVYQSGLSGGSMENYTVTVVNTGSTTDSYTLSSVGQLGWTLSLDNTSFSNVPSGENRQTTLRVTVPSGSVGTLDNITVTATGTGVSDSAGCFAYRGEAEITGWGDVIPWALKYAQVDMDFLVGDGSELVVAFYAYNGTTLLDENIIAGGVKTVKTASAVRNPGDELVRVAKVVLKSDGSRRNLDKRLKICQNSLRARYIEILIAWAQYPQYQPQFRDEIIAILIRWAQAPANCSAVE